MQRSAASGTSSKIERRDASPGKTCLMLISPIFLYFFLNC